ncbi:MAG: DUF1292 domain-containing protein [Clostridia bacterium]|jgi:uncharacterized protein YrzB (UPF0473 family)|nr:DUF1292 domain-containing protein [Clostridia bacterium]
MEERDDILALTDEEGNEVNFEIIDALEHEGKTYVLLTPAEAGDEDEVEVVMLRVDDAGDEDVLVTVDDEDEFNTVAALFDAKAEEYDLAAVDGCDCDCDCGDKECGHEGCDCGCDHCHE